MPGTTETDLPKEVLPCFIKFEAYKESRKTGGMEFSLLLKKTTALLSLFKSFIQH